MSAFVEGAHVASDAGSVTETLPRVRWSRLVGLMVIIIPQRETIPPPKSQRRGTHHQNIAGDSHELSSFFKAVLHYCFQIARRAFAATQPIAEIPSRM